MKAFSKHLQTTQTFGERVDPKRKPCFRASAIFPAVSCAEYTTRVLFMGYWVLKRDIPEVHLLVTLRGEFGDILLRKSAIIDTPKARTIELEELLGEATPEAGRDGRFLGSIEVEVFATRDLVYAFPAFVINYYNEHSVASVHSTGRVYNDLEDLAENDDAIVPECGFDVLLDEGAEPFFSFVNGPNCYPDASVGYEVLDDRGRPGTGVIRLGEVRPYQVVHVRFRDHIDFSPYAGAAKATIKLCHPFRGFFPRFLAGNLRPAERAVSLTHTYYDCSEQDSDDDYWTNGVEGWHDSAVLLPLFLDHGAYTQLVFYPIFSPTSFDVSLTFRSRSGELLHSIEQWRRFDSRSDRFYTIDFGEVLESVSLPGQTRREIASVDMRSSWNGADRIPTRIKFGLNVGLRDAPVDLPCNICFGSPMANPKILGKPGTFKWSPVLNHGRSVVAVTNGSTLKDYDRLANLEICVRRERDDEVFSIRRSLAPNGVELLDVSEDAGLRDFLGGEPGWVTVKSDNPFVNSWYFDFTRSGAVAGDHAF